MNTKRLRVSVIAAAIAATLPMTALGADDITTLKKEVEQLKQELSNLRTLVQNQNQKAATKEEVKAVQTEVSRVATKSVNLFDTNSMDHLSGYGAIGYTDRRNTSRSFDMASFNPIFHYQYKDLLLFQTELTTAVQPDGSTSVALEYANFNLFLNDYVSLFGGKFLTPVGYFFQNVHPAWVNKFASRPPGFGGAGSAAPESDVGAGVRGGFPLGGTARANYAFYVGNGPRLELNAAGDEIEMVEGEGATTGAGNSKFYGGRFGLLPIPGLEFGASAGTSRLAAPGDLPRRSYNVAGADFAFKRRSFDLRGEYIQQRVGDLATSAAPQGGTWKTWYTQVAYGIPATKWEPVVRYGDFNSPHGDQELRQWGLGLNYWFTANTVGKIGYEFNRGAQGTANDNNRLLLQFAYGF